MASQIDWVGAPPKLPFKDNRPQRDSVAEQKATLTFLLNLLVKRIPRKIKQGGSVNAVREWRKANEEAAKVLASTRASVNDLNSQIAKMRRYFDADEQ